MKCDIDRRRLEEKLTGSETNAMMKRGSALDFRTQANVRQRVEL